jgi:hypothetical protein
VTNILPKQEVKMLLHHCLVFTFETGGSQIKDCEIRGTNVASKKRHVQLSALATKFSEKKNKLKKAGKEEALRLARST